jgi:hypothetical protein
MTDRSIIAQTLVSKINLLLNICENALNRLVPIYHLNSQALLLPRITLDSSYRPSFRIAKLLKHFTDSSLKVNPLIAFLAITGTSSRHFRRQIDKYNQIRLGKAVIRRLAPLKRKALRRITRHYLRANGNTLAAEYETPL